VTRERLGGVGGVRQVLQDASKPEWHWHKAQREFSNNRHADISMHGTEIRAYTDLAR
jgi:hypothetical protein